MKGKINVKKKRKRKKKVLWTGTATKVGSMRLNVFASHSSCFFFLIV
uniref:Uncharacterized protein n=1 Tax=Rhizophora mucronata TaxID=61149 RepID=A0A2P2MER7_RHIMU